MATEYPEILSVVSALKKIMKDRKITYKTLADHLDVSEQTIVRSFNGQDLTMNRLVDVCRYLEVSFFDLVHHANTREEETFTLTTEQEQFLADNPRHYTFLGFLRGGLFMEDLKREHKLTDAMIYKYLRDLEKEGLVEVYEKNRYKLLHRGGQIWIEGGPLRRRYSHEMAMNLMQHLYDQKIKWDDRKDKTKEDSTPNILGVMDFSASAKTLKAFHEELQQLLQQYRTRLMREEAFLLKEQRIPAAMIVGMAAPYDFEISIQPLNTI